ncbi:MAG: Dabb family protein [Cyclobacteriaceae bacterium]
MNKTLYSVITLLLAFSCQQTQQSNADTESENVEVEIVEYEGDTDATIIHTVAFSLMHEPGSTEARKFLEDGRRLLSTIPSVQQFEVRKETSPKNDFEYGFSMKFSDQAAYDAYNEHPIHVDFVKNRWKKEVSDFMELDYIVIE